MKRILTMLLLLLMVGCMLIGCAPKETGGAAGDTQPTQAIADPDYDPLHGGKTLKVLAIGNSFSNDTTHYLPAIARAEGFDNVMVGNLYISGCKLDQHATNAATNAAAYKYYTNFDGAWESIESCSLSYALKSQDWDIITMQQGSTYSGRPDSYEPYLTQLIEYVNANKTNPNALLVWNMTWAYQADFEKDMFQVYDRDQMKMYNAIIDTVKSKVESHSEISRIMPCGSAIQNARTSYFGDTLTRDGYHLSDLGRVIASYTWLVTFTQEPLSTINFTNVSDTLTLTDADKAVIVEAVNAAFAQPYAITNSQYTEAPAVGG